MKRISLLILVLVCIFIQGCIFPSYWTKPDYRFSITAKEFPVSKLYVLKSDLLAEGFEDKHFRGNNFRYYFDKDYQFNNSRITLSATIFYEVEAHLLHMSVVGSGANRKNEAVKEIERLMNIFIEEIEKFTQDTESEIGPYNSLSII